MNTTELKSYAPAARRAFIRAVTDRAHVFGLSETGTETVEVKGDFAMIGGRPYPGKVVSQRDGLAARIAREGFGQVMEAVAYTWFNRFAALRYMEIHGYLEHGYRVLSHPNGGVIPEILEKATEVELPGVKCDQVVSLKLDGSKDAELYRLLLVAQCNALADAMPFLFERIDDETELLLPDNLLHTDSLIRKLVTEIEEEDWQQVEIVGWLYQFYISERKDEVIGKVVKNEDIPAATQLFTPNWIVKYMVQNSLGMQWLATYPNSSLKGQMEYYIEPAEQTDKVKAELAAITPSTLNPEALTLIDPASGSGHILIEAYDLFKAIYLERGYRQRDVAQLILEKNLFGLEICPRAAQLTGFALMMKGRADDRRLFERGVKLNVMALQDSTGFDAEGLAKGMDLAGYGLKPVDLTELKQLFEHATIFGSLIQVPEALAKKLPALKQLSEATSQDLFVSEVLKRLKPLVRQAEMLEAQYDAVVVNPPYMGGKGMNSTIKQFTKDHFPDAKLDLFACFIERSYTLAKQNGHSAMVTMQSWMFLSAFEDMRAKMLTTKTIKTMVQIGYNSFPSMNSKVAQATAFTLFNQRISGFVGIFTDLNSAPQSANKDEVFRARKPDNRYCASAERFEKIPGSPIAYAVSDLVLAAYSDKPPIAAIAKTCNGMTTSDNERFLRLWHELSFIDIGRNTSSRQEALEASVRWVPYNKGGSYRKWWGNQDFVIDWKDDGKAVIDYAIELSGSASKTIRNLSKYFEPCVTWSRISSGPTSFRYFPSGFIFDVASCAFFLDDETERLCLMGFLNSHIARGLLSATSPTLTFEAGAIGRLPFEVQDHVTATSQAKIAWSCIEQCRLDWDAYERSWDFRSLPILTASPTPTPTLESSYTAWTRKNRDIISEMKRLEEENNLLFINAYGLQDELSPDVPIEQITLTVNPAYRYGGNLTEEEQWTRFRQETMEELVSYAIGCMMGRYSLDEPGLIYADAGNSGFDPTRYKTFAADADGIVPIMEEAWFADDAANRVRDFLVAVWGDEKMDANLAWLAESLGSKGNESALETVRRYLSTQFFKDHLQAYKRRPIYWLFSSGKHRAFECLVYLHRYNEATLSRMRAEYVTPLQGKLAARVAHLQDEVSAAPSTAARNKLQKQLETAKKKQAELTAFDDLLRHYADQRIRLDLDDGVKVNYGKFGNLLAEVKAVTGGASDD